MKRFKKMLAAALATLLPLAGQSETLFTCGDSTMADYATDGSTPTRGWGQYFGSFFSPDITVVNRGKGGMDVRGFYDSQAYWPTIKRNLRPGDYVLLQFAHNDEKNGGMDGQELYDYYISIGDAAAAAAVDKRGSKPNTTYVATLRKLLEEIRECGANPILASSVCRMNFANGDIRRAGRHDLGDNFELLTPQGPTKGNSLPADDHSMDYRWQMESLAQEMGVPFIDLTQSSRELFVAYGEAKCKQILSDGQGGTHLSVAGAALIARQCAELMVEQNILADKIIIGEAGLTLTPNDGNLGTAYTGNILSKEFTVSGFGLTPEAGNVTVAASAPFEVSTDKSRWAQTLNLAYEGGTLINTFYVRTSVSETGVAEGTLTLATGNTESTLTLTAEGLPIPGSGAASFVWPLADNDHPAVDPEDAATASPLAATGLEAEYDGAAVRLAPAGAHWPAGDIDENPDRYAEVTITAPENKVVTINGVSLSVGGYGTDRMQMHATYSAEADYANPRTFFSPAAMTQDAMTEASTGDILLTLNPGETLRIRLYPWTTDAAEGACLRVSNLAVKGFVANAATEVNLAWPLDKGAENPAAADTQSAAFSFTDFNVGSDLSVEGTGKPADRTGTNFRPTMSNQPDYTDAASLTFAVRPKAGITFQPSKVSFYATRNGTGGGLIKATLAVDDAITILGEDLAPARNNTPEKETRFELPVEGVVVYNNTLILRLAIRKLADNKTLTIHDVVIEGKVSGSEVASAKYHITAVSSNPDAGVVTISPNTATFDENIPVTVAASENFGYRFKSWTADGQIVSTANPYTFAATRDIALTADYETLTVYPLSVALEGGAADYMVSIVPEGHLENGLRYYEAGTEVRLAASGNRILTFTNWEDNTTSAERIVTMDDPRELTAVFSSEDYIVGWDFHNDDPASERAADFKAESDNAGLMSLHNEEGRTSSWLARGVNRGDENGRYAARIWKARTEKLFYEISFGAKDYTSLRISSALSCTYNTYSCFMVQWSTDGRNYTDLGEMNPGNRSWTEVEFSLPAEADNAERVYIRWYPDFDSELIGSETDYDGLDISDVFVLAEATSGADDVPPVLTATIPANGAEGASVTGSVVLTFDEKIAAGSGRASLGGLELEPVISGKTAVFRYSGLSYGTEYTFAMPPGVVTDRNGNPADAVELSFRTMERAQPQPRLYDAVVDIDGSGDYTSVQAAVDAAPTGSVTPWLIFVHNGRYEEHVDIPANKPFVHIIGQDREKTVIADGRVSGGDNAVHVSVGATVVVNSNDCLFENITIENSYGHQQLNGPQALALNTAGDRTIFNNVAMLSYQDTWITPSKSAYRAYVKDSFIEGAVDFIYNSGDVYIENTTLYIVRQAGGFIVAPSHAKDVKWGYVFRDCTITAPGDPSKTSVWLGRPWHNFPKTVFLNTRAEVTIPAKGWYETMGGLPVIWADWNTVDADGNPLDLSQRQDTYYYIDRTTNERVEGKAKNFLTDEEAAEYTLQNVLGGEDAWQPAVKTEACAAPDVQIGSDGVVSWSEVPFAICYVVTCGDEVVAITTETVFAPTSPTGERYAVQAVNEFGGLSAKAFAAENSGVGEIVADETIVRCYDLCGNLLAAPRHGVNIVVTTDAAGNTTAKKVMLR